MSTPLELDRAAAERLIGDLAPLLATPLTTDPRDPIAAAGELLERLLAPDAPADAIRRRAASPTPAPASSRAQAVDLACAWLAARLATPSTALTATLAEGRLRLAGLIEHATTWDPALAQRLTRRPTPRDADALLTALLGIPPDALAALPDGAAVRLRLGDGLAALPWEALPWARRLILWRDPLDAPPAAPPEAIRRAALLAPAYPAPLDVPHAAAEAKAVRAAARARGWEVATPRDGAWGALAPRLAAVEWLHFSGHGADEGVGWRLAGGATVSPAQIAALPRLRVVISNACGGDGDASALGAALRRAGAAIVVAGTGELPDRQARRFAEALYTAIAGGASLGEAVQRAREGIAVTAYQLWGDPASDPLAEA